MELPFHFLYGLVAGLNTLKKNAEKDKNKTFNEGHKMKILVIKEKKKGKDYSQLYLLPKRSE